MGYQNTRESRGLKDVLYSILVCQLMNLYQLILKSIGVRIFLESSGIANIFDMNFDQPLGFIIWIIK